MTTNNLIKLILNAGSIAGLFSLFYTISEHRKKRAKFSFDFHGSASGNYEKDNLEFAKFRWEGTIKNESLTENSIVEIGFIVWANKARTRCRTNGMIFTIEDSNSKEKISLPINFKPRESKKITIIGDILLTGTHNDALFKARRSVHLGSPFVLPENEWDLIFKDVSHNLFDEKGILRSQKLIDLWWTLPNATRGLNDGNIFPTLREYLKIFFTWIFYWIKRFFRFLGL
jgi:hypothetical protein